MISFLLCLALLIIGYFVYGKIVDNTFGPDDRETPAVRINDGVDYVVMPQWKLFLVQLLNIAGLGPIFGALQGALWGPVVFLWITFGTIFAGGVHDYFSGMMSERNDGASIAEVTGRYLGPVMQNIMRVFSVVLLIMVGTVFAVGPAGLIVTLCKNGGMLNSDEMMKMFHLMEDKGVILSIDMIEGDLQVGEMEEIISECPGLKIAIGHFGMVTKPDWKKQIMLARHKNVMIESGGITWLFNDEFYPFNGAIRAINEAADLVGFEKLMWGSDYPRTITAITYKMSYDFVIKSKELEERSKKLFLGENAKAFYGFKNLPELPYIKNMSE